MENKKTKLTISGKPNKSFKKFDSSKSQGKKTVIIDNQKTKNPNKGGFNKSFGSKTPSQNFKRGVSTKPIFSPKTSTTTTHSNS